MANHAIGTAGKGRWNRIGSFLWHEFRKMLPPTLFFFVGLNLILLTKRLILADYLLQFSGFLLATTSALLIGKTVLVADLLPLMRRFQNEPLIKPVLFKSVVYTVLVLLVRLIEALVHYLVEGGLIGGGKFLGELLGEFSWHHFIVTQLWIFVLFLIYVSANDIDKRLGGGALYRAFFTRQPIVPARAT